MRANHLRGQLLCGVGDGRAPVVGQLRADNHGGILLLFGEIDAYTASPASGGWMYVVACQVHRCFFYRPGSSRLWSTAMIIHTFHPTAHPLRRFVAAGRPFGLTRINACPYAPTTARRFSIPRCSLTLSSRLGSSKSAGGEPDELRSCPPDIATRLTAWANRERC
jgi:hypothetical protein